jgi:hypothetical protein
MRLRDRVNSWKRLFSRRPLTTVRRTSLGVETLEDRVVPAINPSSLLSPLATPVSNLGNQLTPILQSANTVLPIIDQPLSSLASQASGAVQDLFNAINPLNDPKNPLLSELTNVLNSATPTKDQVAQAISDALPGLAQNVNVLTLDPAGGNIEVTMNLVKPLVTTAVPFNFGIGDLKVLPFKITAQGQINVTADVEYDNLDFGLSAGQFFLNNNQSGRVALKLGADMLTQVVNNQLTFVNANGQPFSMSGEFGLLYVTAQPDPNGNGVGLHGSVVANVTGTGTNVSLSTPQLGTFTANADLLLTGRFNPPGQSSLSMPQVQANFHLAWDMSGSNPDAGLAGLGSQAPTVQLNHVRVGLGSFLSSAIAPIVNIVQEVTAPIQPALDVLEYPIPGLSDLGVGKVSLLKLVGVLNDTGIIPVPYQQLVSLAINLSDLVNAVNTALQVNDGNVYIDTGSFDLGQMNGGDLRDLVQLSHPIEDLMQQDPNGNYPNLDESLSSLQTLGTAVGNAATKLADLVNSQIPDGSPLKAPMQAVVQQIASLVKGLSNGYGIDVEFPLIEQPEQGAIQLLLGHDVDLVTFSANFNIHTGNKELIDLPLWGPIHFQMDGSLDLTMHFEAGYDTYGFREFLAHHEDPTYLANGLYIDASQPLIDSQAGVTASLEGDVPPPIELVPNPAYQSWLPPSPLNPPVVPASVSAALNATLSGHFTLRLNDPTGSSKFRLFENADKLNGQLFDVQGGLSADLSFVVDAKLGPITVDEPVNVQLGHVTLIDSSKIDPTNPLDPPPPPGSLFGNYQPAVSRTLHVADYPAAPGQPDLVNVYRDLPSDGRYLDVWVNDQRLQYDTTQTSDLTIVGSGNDSTLVFQEPNIPIHVQEPGGHNKLIEDDTVINETAGNIYDLTDHSISRHYYDGEIEEGPYTVDYTGVDDVELDTPAATNTVNVDSLPAFPVSVYTTYIGFGTNFTIDNTINVYGHALENAIKSGQQLNIWGDSPNDNLVIQDDSNGLYNEYDINSNAIAFSDGMTRGSAVVNFDGLKSVSLTGQNVPNPWPRDPNLPIDGAGWQPGDWIDRFYMIDSWSAATALTLTGDVGDDTINVGHGQMDNVSGPIRDPLPISINGGTGHDTLILDDSFNNNHSYQDANNQTVLTWSSTTNFTINGTSVSRTNSEFDWVHHQAYQYEFDLTFTNIPSVQVKGGQSNTNTFEVLQTVPGVAVSVDTGAGNDTVDAGVFSVNLGAPLTLTGHGTNATLNVNDGYGAPNGYYIITANLIDASRAPINYSGFTNVNLTASQGNDHVTVQSTPAGTNVTVAAGNGFAQADLDGLQGPLTVNGGGSAELWLTETNAAVGHAFDVTATSVAIDGGTPLTYSGLSSLWVWGSEQADNTFSVESTAAGVATSLMGGERNNSYQISPNAHDLDAIQGPVSLGGGGGGTVAIHDEQAPSSPTYTVTEETFGPLPIANVLNRSGAASISFLTDVSPIDLWTAMRGGTVSVQSLVPNTVLNIHAWTDDTIDVGSPPAVQGTVNVSQEVPSVTINASALGVSAVDVDGTWVNLAGPTAVQMSPGQHYVYLQGVVTYFTVNANGTVDYDTSLDGALSGRGTTTLALLGRAVTLDLSALGVTTADVDGAWVNLNGPTPLNFMPGQHYVYLQGVVTYFTVNANGTVDYDTSLDGALSGRGSSSLVFQAP